MLFKYDKYGNEIEHTSRADSAIYSSTYIYDKKGNWINRIRYNNTVAFNITIRKITYN